MTDKPGRRACAGVLVIGSASGDQPAGLGVTLGREGSPVVGELPGDGNLGGCHVGGSSLASEGRTLVLVETNSELAVPAGVRVQVGIDAAITSNHHVCVRQVGADGRS